MIMMLMGDKNGVQISRFLPDKPHGLIDLDTTFPAVHENSGVPVHDQACVSA